MSLQPPWPDRLTEPLAADHLMQLYDRRRCLVEVVGLFAGAGLHKGEAIVLVTTPLHGAAIEQRLQDEGFEVPELRDRGQIRILDAADALGRFLVGGWPDPALFTELAGRAIDEARRASRAGRARVYGEMVDLLWRRGDLLAAMRLEDLWNDAIAAHQVPLLCGYGVDQESAEFPPSLERLHLGVIPVKACA
jgi:hypothetical protein